MNDNKNSDKTVSTEETAEVKTDVVETTEETEEEPSQESKEDSQDPIKSELDKIQKKGKGKTELEKAIFTKKQIEKRIAELKGETGDEELPEEVDDNAPVTVGMLKKIQKEQTVKTALALSEDIEDEHEKELTKYHLQNTIKPSGNAQEDFRNARTLVNALKNKQIIEEVGRKPKTVKRTSSGGSAPAKYEEPFEPTAEELKMMSFKGLDGKPLLTKEDILKSRQTQK